MRTNSLQQKAYRSRYYERDNARRRMLAAERRKIRRRTTTNPCPSPDEFRAAFADVARSVEAKILFGGMVHDLACHVDVRCPSACARDELFKCLLMTCTYFCDTISLFVNFQPLQLQKIDKL